MFSNFLANFLVFSIIFDDVHSTISTNIGVFHDAGDLQSDIPLRYIIYRNNYESDRLKFNKTVRFINNKNSVQVVNSFCEIINENDNIIALFGTNLETSPILQSTCNKLKIPYIQTHWLPTGSYLDTTISLNFYPESELLATGLNQIISSLNWYNFLILYQHPDGLIRLKEVIKHKNVMIEKLRDNLLISLKTAINYNITNLVIDSDLDMIENIFKHAKELDMLSSKYNYFLTSLDGHTLKLSEFQCNITTISIFDPYEQTLRDLVKFWERNERLNRNFLTIDPLSIKTETVLIHDAMSLLVDSVNSLRESLIFSHITCENGEFEIGPAIIAQMKENFMHFPITGLPEFDLLGKRTNFTLYLYDNLDNEMIATWNAKDQNGVVFKRDNDEIMKGLQRSVVIIATSLRRPYVMLRPNHEDLLGNRRFEGYCIDLITKIAKIANFTFEIQLVGHVQEILDSVYYKTADLGIADITVTPNREEMVDFSLPFMRLGISLVYRKLDVEDSTWKFLDPITIEVWMYTGALTIALAVVLYFVARMAPGDWENPHPCDQSPKNLTNIWTIKNCMWLTLGSIMNQGCDILPKGISSRWVSSIWWFFALIVTQSYIASLAAFLTNKKTLLIKDIEDLARQNKIIYGTQQNSATYGFFATSNNTIYQKMFETMASIEQSLEPTVENGFERVLSTEDGSYAFLTESTTIEYEVERNCKLRMVKQFIQPRTFGIAMPRNYAYRSIINDAILHLEEDGELIALKNYWWRERKENPPCTEKEAGAELTIEQLRGVFLILAYGCLGALILGFLEFLYSVYNVAVENHMSFLEAFKIEGMFALKIWISEKRIKCVNNESNLFINNKSTTSLNSNK